MIVFKNQKFIKKENRGSKYMKKRKKVNESKIKDKKFKM